MKGRLVAFAAVVAGGLAALFLLARPAGEDASRPTLAASIHPLADIVRNVAGPGFQVDCLLPPGASPHTFEPTVKQMRLLARSRLFFQIGLDLELWAKKLVAAAGVRVVTVSDGIEPLPYGGPREGGHDDEPRGLPDRTSEGPELRHGHAREEPREHGVYDPHIWLDPVLAIAIVENIAEALSEADPAGSSGYAERAREYAEKLRSLDAEFRQALRSERSEDSALGARPVPGPLRFVAFHNAYAYLARRYGLEIVGVVEESPGKEPGARHVGALVEAVRERGARAVLVEPQFSPRIAEAIARDAGAYVLELDPLGDPADPRRATYLDLMRFNLGQLSRAGLAPPRPSRHDGDAQHEQERRAPNAVHPIRSRPDPAQGSPP